MVTAHHLLITYLEQYIMLFVIPKIPHDYKALLPLNIFK